MGNQQTLGLKLCTTEYVTEYDDFLTERFMEDKEFRIDYRNTEKRPRKKLGAVQHQQRVLVVPCQQQESEETVKVQLPKTKSQIVLEVKDVPEFGEKIFEGLFGDVIVQVDRSVKYVDSTGKERYEKFIGEQIRKTFPLGISLGGLTKSVWFKNAWGRDICFAYMTASSVVAGSETDLVSEDEEVEGKCNYKVFSGIKGNQVFVYPDNHVVYTDIDGETHNVSFKMSKIKKCFPNGICFGGLPRTIWLSEDRERDRCFFFMKRQEEALELERKERIFTGLYGDVLLRSDYEIEFSSLMGDRVTCTYDPRKIRQVFPMGITSKNFPTTIWFEEKEECETCFRAMKVTC